MEALAFGILIIYQKEYNLICKMFFLVIIYIISQFGGLTSTGINQKDEMIHQTIKKDF